MLYIRSIYKTLSFKTIVVYYFVKLFVEKKNFDCLILINAYLKSISFQVQIFSLEIFVY